MVTTKLCILFTTSAGAANFHYRKRRMAWWYSPFARWHSREAQQSFSILWHSWNLTDGVDDEKPAVRRAMPISLIFLGELWDILINGVVDAITSGQAVKRPIMLCCILLRIPTVEAYPPCYFTRLRQANEYSRRMDSCVSHSKNSAYAPHLCILVLCAHRNFLHYQNWGLGLAVVGKPCSTTPC